jgi:hypothetical protein
MEVRYHMPAMIPSDMKTEPAADVNVKSERPIPDTNLSRHNHIPFHQI